MELESFRLGGRVFADLSGSAGQDDWHDEMHHAAELLPVLKLLRVNAHDAVVAAFTGRSSREGARPPQ
jgi:hypothetical protein